ncbi:FkbM family methyltransferase [Terrarubrum flagellatum]|uniref:FkbM family methyltransferase n=1 Tax=Terrirubrum flagellatum TaxID=2895980 RepID=UPI0031454305
MPFRFNDALKRHADMPFSDAPMGAFAPTTAQRAIIETSRRAGLGNGHLRKHGAGALLALRPAPVDYDYFGLTLRFYPALCGSARHMLMSPSWSERKERAFMLERTPDDGVFVDIGVNVGFFLFYVAAKRPRATVLGFEPAPKYHALDSFNIAQNKLANVHLFNAAVADKAGVAHFNLEGESLAHGSGAIEVATIPLIDALRERAVTRIDCLKIDVEGVEDKALAPFFREADRSLWPKAVIIEDGSAYWEEDVLAFMLASGYREAWRSRLNVALVLSD